MVVLSVEDTQEVSALPTLEWSAPAWGSLLESEEEKNESDEVG